MVSGLSSALDWYQKKIGLYDKQSWEKTVDQRISRGVCAVPKKTTRIKTELIDVDLVRGSAFPKAKPKHSWIAATISGVVRVILLPLYFTWWQLQTNTLVSSIFVILYFLQMTAMYFYFTADDSEFPDVPIYETLIPAVMMLILGILHSQIVATFSSKSSHKQVTRTKRKKVKRKSRIKMPVDNENKSSPETASEDKPCSTHHSCQTPTTNESGDDDDLTKLPLQQNSVAFDIKKSPTLLQNALCIEPTQECLCKYGEKLSAVHQKIETKKNNSDEESGLDDLDFAQPKKVNPLKINLVKCKTHHDSGICVENASNSNHICHCNQPSVNLSSTCQINQANNFMSAKFDPKSLSSFTIKDADTDVSSGEEYFVAKKPSYSTEEWKKYLIEMKNNTSFSKHSNIKKDWPKSSCTAIYRRYSDDGPVCNTRCSKSKQHLELRHPYSEDGILTNNAGRCTITNLPDVSLISKQNRNIDGLSSFNLVGKRNCSKNRMVVPPSLCLPVNIKRCCSSCESGADTTAPNSPSKPQTSDLEWPLITNTDCNSDSSDCSSQSSHDDESDLTPSENPFAWEMQETATTSFNVGYTGSDKGSRSGTVSCTIWERNECKKVDLTLLDISSAIIRKVDSSIHSTEYLTMGFLLAAIISILPLLFRLQSGTAIDTIQDVTLDVMHFTIPSADDTLRKIQDLIVVTLGSKWRVRLVVMIIMIERFTLSFTYFFLLSVAEKTFKQRFLYAKHFCHLTSSRRARRSDLPHFRLNKVRNIKTWLSVRSYLKKLGPQRSVDVIVSIAFILEVCVLSFLCVQLLKETGQFASKLHCVETLYWTLALGFYLLRFMIIGSKINKKYRNLSVLITEQINLYLHMEQKPHKKEELMLANSVLKLAADLLKELESPFKISGLCANPYLYNITKVVVLSAFSAVLTEILGFKLKLYKIKIK